MSTQPLSAELVFFASTERLSREDAEHARCANRANQRLGVTDADVVYAGSHERALPLYTGAARAILARFPIGTFTYGSVEGYAVRGQPAGANVYVKAGDKVVGFIRIRMSK